MTSVARSVCDAVNMSCVCLCRVVSCWCWSVVTTAQWWCHCYGHRWWRQWWWWWWWWCEWCCLHLLVYKFLLSSVICHATLTTCLFDTVMLLLSMSCYHFTQFSLRRQLTALTVCCNVFGQVVHTHTHVSLSSVSVLSSHVSLLKRLTTAACDAVVLFTDLYYVRPTYFLSDPACLV